MHTDSGDSSEYERSSNSGDSSEDEISSNSGDSSEDETSSNSPLSPDGHLLLWEDPIVWIQKNPTCLLSVRRLKLDFRRRGGKGIIGDFIGHLTELTHLSIFDVKTMTCLPNILTTLPNLQMLHLERCYKLQELPPNLGDLEGLTSLSIVWCSSIKSLPDSLAKLSKLTKLDILHCNGLEELPSKFGELGSLAHFKLTGCWSIKSLPSSVANLSKLTTLYIHSCRILQDFAANLGDLKSLTHICIQYCASIKECPSNLNVVDLSLQGCCSIQSLPRGLSNLTLLCLPFCSSGLENLKYFVSLRYLKFSSCKWHVPEELPGNFYLDNIAQLSIFDIKDTRIKWLPSSITKLSKLRLLLLPYDFILETLPYQLDESLVISVEMTHVRKTWKELKKEMEIFSCPTVGVDPSRCLRLAGDSRPCIQNKWMVQILHLELEDGCKEDITESIAELAELTHLYISGGYRSQLPLTFTRIKHLFLHDCEPRFDSLGKLSSLESLYLSLCIDTDQQWPAQMDLPVSLRQLSLCFVSSDPVPLLDGMTKLSNLKALHLSGMPLDSLPENLNIEKLRLVNCSMTDIKILPTSLQHVEIIRTVIPDFLNEICLNQLVNVETLSVTCHYIKFLPSITALHNLKELNLKDCFSLKKLPPRLDVMVNLCTLNVSGTRIKSLPCSISKMPKLQCLILPKCFQRGSLPLELKFQPMVSFDETNEKYYKDMGYYDSDLETSSDDDDDTTNTIEGVSEEGIISQQHIPPPQLLSQPDAAPILGDSHVSEANHSIGENSHPILFSYQNQETEILPFESEQLTDDKRLSNSQNPCFPSSQHALQPEHIDSMTLEIEHGQHDFSRGTGNNLLVSDYGQNEDNKHSEDYSFDGRDNNPINENSHQTIYHSRNQEETIHFGGSSQHDLQNVQMPENMTCVSEEVLKNTEEHNIAEQQTSFRQLLNLPNALPAFNSSGRNDLIGEKSHHAISHSQNQVMEHLSSRVCDKMITDLGSNFHNTVSFGKNGQHAVQDGQMNIRNSGTEHAITFLNQDISSCDERGVSHSVNNLNALENDQIENNSENEGKKGKRKRNEITLEEIQSQFGRKQKDVAIALGVKLSTIKRRCRELGIKSWPSSRMSRRHCNNKRKASSKAPSKSEYSQHVVECLDGVNKHVLSNDVPDHVPSGSNVVDNSTQRHRDSDQRVQQHLDGTNLGTSSTIVQPNECSRTIVVKATYKDDQVKVYFPLSSSVELLRERIGKKLKLDVDKFKMKYQDEDQDLILVADISDLEDALRVSESSGSNVVRLCIFRDFEHVN